MKILHLNTYTHHKNLSFPHYQFHKGLLKEGQESVILSAKGDINEKEILLLNKGGYVPYFGISRLMRKIFFEKFKKNTDNYFYPEWNLDNITEKQVMEKIPFIPDIIITYWTKFAFNQQLIYKLSKRYNAPVLCFMMDMAPMTGGCHYAFDCKNYYDECGGCPALNSKKAKDLSNTNWEFKKKYLDKTNITIIACSSTLVKQASKSSLFKNKKIEKLMLSVDENVFNPKNKVKAQQYFNLPNGKKIIFFGAASLKNDRKGIKYLIESLNILSKNIKDTELKNDILLLVAGNSLPNLKIPFEYKHVGYLKTQKELALAYQASDLFVCPSIEDSGPLMITQSIMSGRPVVSFDMGVAPDLVHTGETGYRAKLKDSSDLAYGIESILSMSDEDWQIVSDQCRKTGKEFCSLSSQTDSLNKILKKILKHNKDE